MESKAFRESKSLCRLQFFLSKPRLIRKSKFQLITVKTVFSEPFHRRNFRLKSIFPIREGYQKPAVVYMLFVFIRDMLLHPPHTPKCEQNGSTRISGILYDTSISALSITMFFSI